MRWVKRFDDVAWTEEPGGRREKRVPLPRGVARLVEYPPGWVEHRTCKRLHVGYLLRGACSLHVDGEGAADLNPGAVVTLPEGKAHRLMVGGARCSLLFFDDAE